MKKKVKPPPPYFPLKVKFLEIAAGGFLRGVAEGKLFFAVFGPQNGIKKVSYLGRDPYLQSAGRSASHLIWEEIQNFIGIFSLKNQKSLDQFFIFTPNF